MKTPTQQDLSRIDELCGQLRTLGDQDVLTVWSATTLEVLRRSNLDPDVREAALLVIKGTLATICKDPPGFLKAFSVGKE